jgi:hypothetical protein
MRAHRSDAEPDAFAPVLLERHAAFVVPLGFGGGRSAPGPTRWTGRPGSRKPNWSHASGEFMTFELLQRRQRERAERRAQRDQFVTDEIAMNTLRAARARGTSG